MSNVYENAIQNDDNIPFSKLLFDLTSWWVQQFDNDDASLNMIIFDDYIQVLHALPPLMYIFQWSQVNTCPCNQWVPSKCYPLVAPTHH
jgi:hypothetical protein